MGAMNSKTDPPTSSDLTIREFQDFIRRRYYDTDRARGSAGTFLWFVEEVGELATALHGKDPANLAEEFADVFAWLCTLANINDIDMEKALRAKYLTGKGPEGTKE